MFQYQCPRCNNTVYSPRPREAAGLRCLVCGFAEGPGAAAATPAVPATPTAAASPAGAAPPLPPARQPASLAAPMADLAPAPLAPEPPKPPRLPEEWALEQLLGSGSMGEVYRARHRLTDELVALKCVSGSHARQAEYAARFVREVKVLHRLAHPNIVRLLYTGVHDGLPWLAMEFVDGPPLRRLMEAGRLPPARALELLLQVAQALEYTHAQGVVHRDLKPENVLVDSKGGAKVADFGLAALDVTNPRRSMLTRPGQAMGTLDYMAPEQMTDAGSATPAADLYALGVMLFETLAGRVPYGAQALPEATPGSTPALRELAVRLLAREPAGRPTSAEVVAALAGACGRPDVPAAAPIAPPEEGSLGKLRSLARSWFAPKGR